MMIRRYFYAIEFPDNVRTSVAAAQKKLASAADHGRWTRDENLHLTLQFVGDCPEDLLPELSEVLNLTARNCRPFAIDICGCGTFGRNQDILWLGVAKEPRLQKLAGILTMNLEQHQLPHESRPYSPHITIGRQVKIDPAICQQWASPAIYCPINQITLMESTRLEGQLAYVPVLRAALD